MRPSLARRHIYRKAIRRQKVALAVTDRVRGHGLGTLLLERLTLHAAQQGLTRFRAVTQSDNRAMLDVFRDSGFHEVESSNGHEVEVEMSLIPDERTILRSDARHRIATVASLRPFFEPRSIAVVGASRDEQSIGYRLLSAVMASGYAGVVYPINPHADLIQGQRTYRSIRDVQEPPDLAIVAVPSQAVLSVVDDCAARGVRALIVITAGFAETGPGRSGTAAASAEESA